MSPEPLPDNPFVVLQAAGIVTQENELVVGSLEEKKVLGLNLPNFQVAPNGKVNDGGNDVNVVRSLVHENPDFSRTQIIGWLILDDYAFAPDWVAPVVPIAPEH